MYVSPVKLVPGDLVSYMFDYTVEMPKSIGHDIAHVCWRIGDYHDVLHWCLISDAPSRGNDTHTSETSLLASLWTRDGGDLVTIETLLRLRNASGEKYVVEGEQRLDAMIRTSQARRRRKGLAAGFKKSESFNR
jgi:hypothetical protein